MKHVASDTRNSATIARSAVRVTTLIPTRYRTMSARPCSWPIDGATGWNTNSSHPMSSKRFTVSRIAAGVTQLIDAISGSTSGPKIGG